MVKIPQNPAGFLKLPAVSVPIPITLHLLAIMPASPPEDPPVDLSLFYGFNARPTMILLVSDIIISYGMFVFTNIMALALRNAKPS